MPIHPNVTTYRKDIEQSLRYHNLEHLIPYLDNEKRMPNELNKVFKNLGNDKIPTELDWLYSQYNVLKVGYKKGE